MFQFFWSCAAFLIALSILIMVHEFGHFFVARYYGVKVERVSIGLGRALWCYRDKRNTEYIIAAIPLGGYVKMLDGRLETISPELRHEAFHYKTILERASVVAAGPVFNFIFAIIVYWLVFMIGLPSSLPVIADITPHSIVAQAGILSGMEVKSVDGIETPDWDSVRVQLINKIGDNEISISVSSFSTPHIETKILDLRGWKFEPDKQDPLISLGMIPEGISIEPVLTEVRAGSAAARAGLQVGDRILIVDGQPVNAWKLFMIKIRKNPGRALQVVIERLGSTMEVTLIPERKSVDKGEIEGFAGVVPHIIPLSEEYKTIRKFGPISALIQAGKKTWQLMRLTVSILGKLITGDIKLNHLSGPLSIAQGAKVSAEYGLIYYLMFLALISINLGIINLFPLPILDGGHLLFLVIEKIKGRPVSERVQELSYRIGLILVILLMSLGLFNDFSRLLRDNLAL